MIEIMKHRVYELLKTKFEDLYIDYVILSVNAEYKGIETHREAVVEAMRILSARDEREYSVETEKMKAVPYSMAELLKTSDDEYYESRPQKDTRCFSVPETTPYWYAFLEPPYGVPYLNEDFREFNSILFPNTESCEAYRWNDEFSDYFDAGKEWWGTGMWTIFDSVTKQIVIIGASLTD